MQSDRLCSIAMFIVAASAFIGFVPEARSQGYPVKSIRMVIGSTPGGGTDTLGRMLNEKVSESLGQQVIIENRPGAQGNIGTAYVAKSAPDGYTVVMSYVGTFAIAPWMYADVGFHPLRDFSHVTQLSSQAYLVVVHPNVPARNMKELVALAKSRPGELTFAGPGQAAQMAGELFKITTGSNLTHVPYKGTSPALTDLMGGHISIMFAAPTGSVPHIKSGRLRGLVVSSASRLSAAPDVPSSREAGYPAFEVNGWYGLSAPANTPKEIVAKLNAEYVRVLRQPDMRDRIAAIGLIPAETSSDQFTAYVKAEFDRWGPIVKQSGVKAE